MAKSLGIDLGSVRIGIAVSDPEGRLALPRETLERKSPVADLAAITALVKEEDAQTVVVGHPRTLLGKSGLAAGRAEEFARRLQELLPEVKVVLWDERLSTAQSERALIGAGLSREARRKVVDQSAAALILQSWLDAQKSRIR